MSDEALLDATLAFANGAELQMEEWRERDAETLESQREVIRGYLERILRGEWRKLAQELLDQGWQKWSTSTVRRAVRLTDEGLEISYHEQLHSAHLLAMWGVALLLSKPLRLDLCKCHYSECQKFFWKVVPTKGPPRRTYCSDEHLKLGHSENVATRARAARRETDKGRKHK